MAKGFRLPSVPSVSVPKINIPKVDTSGLGQTVKTEVAPIGNAVKGIAQNIDLPSIPDTKISVSDIANKVNIPSNIKSMMDGKVKLPTEIKIPNEIANLTADIEIPKEAKDLIGQMPELSADSLLKKYEGKEISVKGTLKSVAENKINQAKNLVDTGKRIKEEGLSGAVPPEYKEMGEMFKESGMSIGTLAEGMKP